MNATTTPRIYVACLASYNNGVLHGAWIDANQSAESIQEEVNEMLRESKYPNVVLLDQDTGEMYRSAEEWAIHDHEGFYGINLSESEPFETVSALASALEECGNPEAFAVDESFANYFDYKAFGRDMEMGGDVWTRRTSDGLAIFYNI